MNKYSINDVNPVLAIEDNLMLMKSGSVAFAYQLNLPEIYTLHLENYSEITEILSKTIYSNLSEDVVIQFQYVFNKKKFTGELLKKETFLQKSTYEHFLNRNYLEQKCYVYFIKPNVASYKSTYSNFLYKTSKKSTNLKIEAIEKFESEVKRTVSILSSYVQYFKFTEVLENDLEKSLKNYFSFGKNTQTDLVKQKDGSYSYGNNILKYYSVCEYDNLADGSAPLVTISAERSTDITKFYRPYAPFGLELFDNHIVNLIIYYDNQKYWKTQLENNIRKLKGSQLMGRVNFLNAEINEGFLNALEQENKKIVRFNYSVLVWSDNENDLNKKTEYIDSAFSKMGIVPYTPDIDLPLYLLGTFPGNADRLPNDETILTYDEYPFLFFNPESNYINDDEGFVFNDRLTNLPVMVDTFDIPYKKKIVDNRNFMVVAPSGGGKSFLIKNVLRQFIEQEKTKTVVINIGGDDKIAKTFEKDSLYYQYEEGKPLGVNPFYIHQETLEISKIDFLIDFMEILWKNGANINHDERSSLEKIFIAFYNGKMNDSGNFDFSLEKSSMNIESFYNYLKKNKDLISTENKLFSIDSLLLNLEKYAIGSYANLFSKGEPPKLKEKKYIEFELDNIKDHPILFPIFGMLISDLTFNTVWQQDGTKKMFFIDEAWKILEKPGMAALLKYLYKTIRKFTGGVGIAVQQITDVPNDELGKAIIGNTSIKYLLNHSSVIGDIPILKDRLSLSERDLSLLLSVRNNTKGKYPHSEFLLLMGNVSKVLRLEVSKEAFVIYDSDKDNLHIFNELWDKTQNIQETVQKYLTK